MTEALRRQLQHDRLGELLAEIDAEAGPVPDEAMEEARKLWQGHGGSTSRIAGADRPPGSSRHRPGA